MGPRAAERILLALAGVLARDLARPHSLPLSPARRRGRVAAPSSANDQNGRGAKEPRWSSTALLALGLCALLVGCAPGSSTSAQATPIATATAAPPATPTPGGPPTPTATPLPGSANLAGATDICTSPISVSTTLPPEIPPYNGQLRLAQASGSAAEFGYCTTDKVSTIASFYAAQLPGKGWQNIQTFENNATRNIIATRGSENLTVTVSPDVVQTGSADLLIIETGRSG